MKLTDYPRLVKLSPMLLTTVLAGLEKAASACDGAINRARDDTSSLERYITGLQLQRDAYVDAKFELLRLAELDGKDGLEEVGA